MVKKKYLVTGGTGFIGSALVKRLVKDGYQVRVLDNNIRGATERLKEVIDKIEFIEGDIRDAKLVEKACEDVEGVIHLAYINGTEYFYSMPELVLDVGIKGMINVIDACIKHKIKELVLASSSEAYQTPPEVPTTEEVRLVVPDVLNPRYSYGSGKIICEVMAINYGRKYFDKVLIFRPHNVYGPDMGWEHVIPQFVLRMKECAQKVGSGKLVKFPIQGTGKEKRAFVYIDDFTDGLMNVIEKGKHLGIYNIGTMEEVAIENVAVEIGKYFGKKVEIIAKDKMKGGTNRRCPDISKLKKLGYKPSVSLQEGIEKTAKWYDANSHLQKKINEGK
jgi:nucleoside-diphosphate-sugar epimerase